MVPRVIITLLVALLLLFGSGCTRESPQREGDIFAHDALPLAAPDGLRGGIWTLHGGALVHLGGIDATTGLASTSIFVFDRPTARWRQTEGALPSPVGAGSAFAAREGILLFAHTTGPENPIEPLWLTPVPSGFRPGALPAFGPGIVPATATIARGFIYVVAGEGGGGSRLFSLEVSQIAGADRWHDLGALPTTAPIAAATVQLDGERPRLFLIPDFSAQSSGLSRHLVSYAIPDRIWHRHDEVSALPDPPDLLTPGGIAHVYALYPATASAPVARWEVFNTVTQAWTGPLTVPVTGRPVAASAQGTTLTSLYADGETATLLTSTYLVRTRGLHPLDYTILAAFILCLFGISWLHSKSGGSADHYFRGGRNVNWLAAGIAIVATRLSSTSFVAIPAKAFSANLQYAMIPVTNLFGAFIMTRWFVKFFVRLNITSGYEYLEKRFTLAVRMVGSLNYLCFEIARIGLLIVVPAVVLASVARFDLTATIIVVGFVATLYTAVGGIKGVVWADTFQIIVKVVGLFIALISVFFLIRGDLSDMLATASSEGKLRVIDWSWDLTRDTFIVFVLFWLTDGLKSYVANQIIIQQFISTRNEATAKRTIWTSAILGVLVTWLLLLIGIGLYLYYRQHPELFDLMIDKPDGVFPWFIVFELPPGVVGILVAALIAAALSSLDQALLSSSTVMVTDFYRRFNPRGSDATALRLGRYLTLAMGLFATVAALFLSGLAVKSLVDQTLRLIGLFGGGLGGLFLLGMLTTRASGLSALCGLAVSVAVQYFVSQHTSLHLLTYMFTGMTSCFVVGYLLGYVLPERKPLDGLTIHTTPVR